MKITKMTRRSLAVLLVMMMVFSLAVPAFADTGIADDTATIAEDHTHDNEAASETADENGDATDTDDVDAEEHVHSFTIFVENTATCDSEGQIIYACECGETRAEIAEALGHDFIIDPKGGTSAPTCTMDGINVYVCTRPGCSAPNVETVPALGHELFTEVVEATCTSLGQTITRCSRENCDFVEIEIGTEVNPLNHVWDEGIETVAPTCIEEGKKIVTCTRCRVEETQSVPTIPHDYAEEIIISEATCKYPAIVMYTCRNCSAVNTDNTGEPLGHTHEEGAEGIVSAPTCTMQGYTTYTCARCGESYQDDYTDMIPHTWDDGIRDGNVTVYTCFACSTTRREPIPPAPSAGGGGGGGGAAAPEPAPVEIVDPEVPLAEALPFDDVNANSWFLEAVKYVYDKDLMGGTDNNTFAPNAGTTRGMIVTILHRMENKPEVTTAAGFSDIAAGKWYSDAVSWAAENEIVKGYEDGSFRPDNSITRQELAAILYRYAEYKQYDVTGRTELSAYADAAAVSAFAKDAVEWAVSEELIGGLNDGTLAPANGATRAQLATILMRFNQNFASESETK